MRVRNRIKKQKQKQNQQASNPAAPPVAEHAAAATLRADKTASATPRPAAEPFTGSAQQHAAWLADEDRIVGEELDRLGKINDALIEKAIQGELTALRMVTRIAELRLKLMRFRAQQRAAAVARHEKEAEEQRKRELHDTIRDEVMLRNRVEALQPDRTESLSRLLATRLLDRLSPQPEPRAEAGQSPSPQASPTPQESSTSQESSTPQASSTPQESSTSQASPAAPSPMTSMSPALQPQADSASPGGG